MMLLGPQTGLKLFLRCLLIRKLVRDAQCLWPNQAARSTFRHDVGLCFFPSRETLLAERCERFRPALEYLSSSIIHGPGSGSHLFVTGGARSALRHQCILPKTSLTGKFREAPGFLCAGQASIVILKSTCQRIARVTRRNLTTLDCLNTES
mmetsp:Transcript_51572/g.133033  ORF Transcript_51572/g.133033 Transcript_51572/m.133033 type:complete len:151 (-) Transcript_51572:1251-1703(-)